MTLHDADDIVFPVSADDRGGATAAAGTLNIDVGSASAAPRVLRLQGELDCFSQVVLATAIEQIRPVHSAVVLDLSGVEFVDSSGLRALLEAREAVAADAGAQLTLTGCSATTLKLFELTGLDGVFELEG